MKTPHSILVASKERMGRELERRGDGVSVGSTFKRVRVLAWHHRVQQTDTLFL